VTDLCRWKKVRRDKDFSFFFLAEGAH
jgi:hypothetical protein